MRVEVEVECWMLPVVMAAVARAVETPLLARELQIPAVAVAVVKEQTLGLAAVLAS